jgi:RNA polymerase sigma-70 factor (sigma-E family)
VNQEQFDVWLTTAAPRLHRAAYLLTADWGVAEDLVQVACATVWEKRARIETPDAYARQVMVRQVTSWRKRRWSGEVPAAALPEHTDDPWSAVDQRGSLAAALAILGQRQRAVLFLRFSEDLTEVETAAVLGWPVGTVKSTTARALEGLRQSAHLSSPHEEHR